MTFLRNRWGMILSLLAVVLLVVGVIALPNKDSTTTVAAGAEGTSTTAVPGSVVTAPAPTDDVPLATEEERSPTVTVADCKKRIGDISQEKDAELQAAGITPANCLILQVSLCQSEKWDELRELGLENPQRDCVSLLLGVTPTTTGDGNDEPAPNGTTPTTAAPSTTTTPTTAGGGNTSSTLGAPDVREPDVIDIAIFLQKVALSEGRVQGVGVTCEVNCLIQDGIVGDTPEEMFTDLLIKGAMSPLFLDDAARTIRANQNQPYEDTRAVGDAGKAGSDLAIVVEFVRGSTVERGVIPAGTTLYNTVVSNGQVVQFSYTTNRDRVYIKFWKDNTFLMYFDSCGNRASDRPTPGVPETPTPPPHDDEPPTTTTPPPTGGPTPTTVPPSCPPGEFWNPVTKKCGKLDTHSVGPQAPTPTQVQGPGPTHPAGPPNTGIENPNPTTGCNPSPCPEATVPTTRPGPPPTVPPIVTSTTYQPPPVATTMPPP